MQVRGDMKPIVQISDERIIRIRGVCFVPKAATDIRNLGVRCGSNSAAGAYDFSGSFL